MKAIQAIGQEDQEERVQRQDLENQLMQMKGSASADIPDAIPQVEERLEALNNDLQSDRNSTAALLRLRGRKDSFTPRDQTLSTDDDQAAEYSIEGLKRFIESAERRAMDSRNQEEVRNLNEELSSARARLRQQGSAAYQRQYARYAAWMSK